MFIRAVGDAITMAALGDINYYNHQAGLLSQGDTWSASVMDDGTVIGAHDDGYGIKNEDYFSDSFSYPGMRFIKLTGVPEDPSSFRGHDVNRGKLQPNNLGFGYHSLPYEVDGILYNWDFTEPIMPNTPFRNPVLRKSTDHAATWTASSNSASLGLKFGWPCFIAYGQGGSASSVDKADQYVYIFSASTDDDITSSDTPYPCWQRKGYYLARVLRSDLPSIDVTEFQYYKGGIGGDGSLDSNWDSNIDNKTFFLKFNAHDVMTKMVYNDQLGRYILTTSGDGDYVFEALHPWGPWTLLTKQQMSTPGFGCHFHVTNAYTRDNGNKMWAFLSGGYQSPSLHYGMHYLPLYFTQAPKFVIEAENATLLGTANTANNISGYIGTGYAALGNTPGNGVRFMLNANQAGSHIVKFSYSTGASSGSGSISSYVNGSKACDISLAAASNKWFDNSRVYYLNAGANTFDLKLDDCDVASGLSIMIDRIEYAFLQSGKIDLGTRYQGETAAFTGEAAVNDCSLLDYYGSGYAQMESANSTITFNNVTAAATKNYKLFIRYSYPNGDAVDSSHRSNIPLQTQYNNIAFYVNFTKVKNLNIGSTCSGWLDLQVENVSLNAGSSNSIQFKAELDSGYPYYIDYIEIVDPDNLPQESTTGKRQPNP